MAIASIAVPASISLPADRTLTRFITIAPTEVADPVDRQEDAEGGRSELELPRDEVGQDRDQPRRDHADQAPVRDGQAQGRMAGDVGDPLPDLGPQVERRANLALLERAPDQGHRQRAGQEAEGVDRDRRAVADHRGEQAGDARSDDEAQAVDGLQGGRRPGEQRPPDRGWASPRCRRPGTSSGASPSAPRSAGSPRSSGRRGGSTAGSGRSASPDRSPRPGSSAAGRSGRRSPRRSARRRGPGSCSGPRRSPSRSPSR